MKCFVIMPFRNENSNSIYENWIKPAVEEIKYHNISILCHRADKSLRPGEVISHLIENLADAEIVIADLTGKNPNVFYELGVRHTLSNNTILISQEIDDIPFDLRSQRIITYKFDPDGMLKLKKDIEESIRLILNSKDTIDNPVRKFIYDKEVKKFFEGSNLPGYNLIETLVNELNSLKKDFSLQFSQITKVVESLTIDKLNLGSWEQGISNPTDLDFYQGAWLSMDSESFLYAKLKDGKLLIPYCYMGNYELVSHYYDLKKIGDYLVGRFQWFKSDISGFMFLKTIDNNTLEGGWWMSEQINGAQQNNFWELSTKIEGMTYMKWERIENLSFKDYPDWAKNYFNQPSRVFP